MGIGVGKPLQVGLNHLGCLTEGYVLLGRIAKLQACLDYLDWLMEKRLVDLRSYHISETWLENAIRSEDQVYQGQPL